MTRHLTRKAALAKAKQLNAAQAGAGRSSGWKRIDYGVRFVRRGVRRWETFARTSSR